MSPHGHDMDHDGKITSKDSAMFHEMMVEDEQRYHNATASSPRKPCTSMKDALKQCIPFFICVGFLLSFALIDMN